MTCVTSGTAERTSARLAHEIWQKDINGRGGLLGRPIELVCYDDGGTRPWFRACGGQPQKSPVAPKMFTLSNGWNNADH
jgi:hypothetical protein